MNAIPCGGSENGASGIAEPNGFVILCKVFKSIEFEGLHSKLLKSAVCSPNRRIKRAALAMDESGGPQFKSSNLMVCTIAKSEILCKSRALLLFSHDCREERASVRSSQW